MLYERAKQLQAKGMSAAEIERTLLAEGARAEDIKVILGSLGFGPQPHPDPTQRPLALARRIMESRALRLLVFGVGLGALAGLGYVLWIIWVVVSALAEGFTRGR